MNDVELAQPLLLFVTALHEWGVPEDHFRPLDSNIVDTLRMPVA
jgi:hypothetical protein